MVILKMGKLAKVKIDGGKRITVEGNDLATQSSVEGVIHTFSELGLEGILSKVISEFPLNANDLEALLNVSKTHDLVSLIGLGKESQHRLEVVPLLLLPLSEWTAGNSSRAVVDLIRKHVSSHYVPGLRVVVDLSGLISCENWILEEVSSILKDYPGIDFVGPSVNQLIVWLSNVRSSSTYAALDLQLEDILHNMKASGFRYLRGSTHRGVLKLVHRCGFPNDHVICLDRFKSPRFLAAELEKLERISRESALINSWSVGFTTPSYQIETGESLDQFVIRAYAVAMLALRAVPACRLWSSHISIEALKSIAQMGANECVFGAVDNFTARELRIFLLQHLRGSLSDGRHFNFGDSQSLLCKTS